jgi:lambda repressor-like predicted transcriptional regulator
MQNSDTTIDRSGVAARLRELLFASAPPGTGVIAETLGVRESMLRDSIDVARPHPWIEVLLAVIRRYGVDPTWILTGRYDHATHREALEDEGSVERLLARTTLARKGEFRSSVLDVLPTIDGPRRAG